MRSEPAPRREPVVGAGEFPETRDLRPAPMDPERLAALLDGRLDGRDRAAALAELASSGAAIEVACDAAAVLEELGQQEAERRGGGGSAG